MKRYSIAPSSSRRKSTIGNGSLHKTDELVDGDSATLELERLEQEVTLVLQEIDKNLSKANAIINDKIFPVLRNYAASSNKVWGNVNFWKYFLEQAANVELTSYEAPAHNSHDINNIAKANGNLLLSDEEEIETREKADNPGDRTIPDKNKFKKPLLKTFGNVEESTPTWSTEQQKMSEADRLNIESSTPQLKQRSSFFSEALPMSTKKGETSTNNKQVQVQTISSEESSSIPKISNLHENLPIITHTVRQSLDNYQQISISPKKSRTPQSTRKSEIMDSARRRSSMIQNFIDSSPTLPEPPVLISDIGYSSKMERSNSSSQGKSLDKLSPIPLLSVQKTTPKATTGDDNHRQRFPKTPILDSEGKELDQTRTPMGIRLRYEEESDIAIPELKKGDDEGVPDRASIRNLESIRLGNKSNTEEDISLPDLETIELHNKRRRISKYSDSTPEKYNKLPNADDDRNVFLDNSAKHTNSAVSTIYHSLIAQKEAAASNESTQNKDSLQGNSRSISYLFEEVLYNANVDENGEIISKVPSNAKNLFDEINENIDVPHISNTSETKNLSERDLLRKKPKDRANDENSDRDEEHTDNTSGLDSLLGERLRNLTNYTKLT